MLYLNFIQKCINTHDCRWRQNLTAPQMKFHQTACLKSDCIKSTNFLSFDLLTTPNVTLLDVCDVAIQTRGHNSLNHVKFPIQCFEENERKMNKSKFMENVYAILFEKGHGENMERSWVLSWQFPSMSIVFHLTIFDK